LHSCAFPANGERSGCLHEWEVMIHVRSGVMVCDVKYELGCWEWGDGDDMGEDARVCQVYVKCM